MQREDDAIPHTAEGRTCRSMSECRRKEGLARQGLGWVETDRNELSLERVRFHHELTCAAWSKYQACLRIALTTTYIMRNVEPPCDLN